MALTSRAHGFVNAHGQTGGETTIYRCDPDKIEPALSVEYGA
jgi:hypothetical protein